MYGKIFTSIYDGSLLGNWEALVTFQQFIVLCDADGFVDMTPFAIATRTSIPLEHIEAGIKFLEQSDPTSRTSDENGCRIVRLDDHRDWGWYIVNHAYYKKLHSKEEKLQNDRTRIAKKRATKKSLEISNVARCRKVSQGVVKVAHTNTNTNTNKVKNIGAKKPAPHPPPKKSVFKIPTLEQVKNYCTERSNSVDAERFVDFYTSKGWKVGKNPMKDWQASVRTWEKSDTEKITSKPRTFDDYMDILKETDEKLSANDRLE